MKKFLTISILGMCLGFNAVCLAQDVEFQGVSTNRHKFAYGDTNSCLSTNCAPKLFRHRQEFRSWSVDIYYEDTNGNNTTPPYGHSGGTLTIDEYSNNLDMTVAVGSTSFSETPTNSGPATCTGTYTNTGMAGDWLNSWTDSGGSHSELSTTPCILGYNDPLWDSAPQTNFCNVVDNNIFETNISYYANQPYIPNVGTNVYVVSYLDEFLTVDLLQPVPSSSAVFTNGSGGGGVASVSIDGDQQNAGISGTRARVKLKVPVDKKFVVPYVIHTHFDPLTNSYVSYPGMDAVCSNFFTGKGDGTPHYYPDGKAIPIHPPYASVSNSTCPYYVGGSSYITIGSFTLLRDDQDSPKPPTNCCVCSDMSLQDYGSDMTTKDYGGAKGMPHWWVSEPYINLWVQDTPVGYTTSLGENVNFTMTYKQHDTRPGLIHGQPPFVPVTGWEHNWFSYAHFNGDNLYDSNGIVTNITFTNWTATVYQPGGGEGYFEAQGGSPTPDPITGDRLLPLGGVDAGVATSGFRLVHPNGSQDIYSQITPFYSTCYTDSIPVTLDGSESFPLPLLNDRPGCGSCDCPFSPGGNAGWAGYWDLSGVNYEDFTPVEVGTIAGTGVTIPPAGTLLLNTNWGNQVVHPIVTSVLARLHSGPSADALLTERIDPYGNVNYLSYSNNPATGQYYLTNIMDYDGNSTKISYDTNGHISRVDMPYSRYATFSYGGGTTNALLLSVTDAQGMTSSFGYSTDDGAVGSLTANMNSMTTPYGTTSFTYFETNKDSLTQTNEGLTRAISILNPDGTSECYAFFNSATNSAPFSYLPYGGVPGSALDVGDTTNTQGAMYLRNSFYWGPAQCAALSTSIYGALTPADFAKGRMRHWMLESDGAALSSAFSMEQAPSPDGTSAGQRTWFVYHSGDEPWIVADDSAQQPETIARVQPDGSTWSEDLTYTGCGQLEGDVINYVKPDSTAGSVTYSYGYDNPEYTSGSFSWSSSRLVSYTAPGESISAYFHLAPLTNSGVVYPNSDYVQISDRTGTRYLYFNSRQQVAGASLATGLTITNSFGMDGFISQSIALETQTTNHFSFAGGLLSTRIDPFGATTAYGWDNLERMQHVFFADGSSVTNGYDKLNLVARKDRLDHLWHASYDSMGRKQSSTDRNGNTTTFGYCVCGGLDSVSDPRSNSVTYSRDLAGQIASATYSGGLVQWFTRDALGRVTHVTNNMAQSFDYTYDNLNRVLRVTTPQGQVYAASYDNAGRPLVATNAAGIVVTNSYDDYERMTEQDYANGMSHHWHYTGDLLTSEDDGVHTSTNGYDPAGRLNHTHDANGNDVFFTYGPAGQLLAMTNQNNATTLWAYDIYGRMIAKTNANNTLVETNGYDANGRMTKHWTPAKGLTQYSYDPNGNTLGVTYSSGAGITAGYDSLNRIVTMSDAVGSSAFNYQNFGPFWSALSSEDGPWASDTMIRSYLINGQPNAFGLGTWSGSYGYDSMRRLTNITSSAGAFTYHYENATGNQIASLGLPGSSTISYGYDPAGLLTSTALSHGGTALDSYTYSYDAVGWRTNVVRADGSHVGYGYDPIGQLTSATGFESNGIARFNENFGYTYDPAGNLTNRMNDTLNQMFILDNANELTNVQRTTTVMTVAGGLTNSPSSLSINGQGANIYADKTFAATNISLVDGNNTFTNALTISGSSYTNRYTLNLPMQATLSYDPNGNQTSDGLHYFEYDCANQLTRITVTNKTKSEFVYDGFGRRRIRREYAWTGSWTLTGETHYVYDGMLVIQERDGNNTQKVTYTRGLDLSGSHRRAGGIGGLLARTDANGPAFYHTDGNGNVTAMANSSGALVAKYLYDPFGNLLNKTGSLADANLYRFSSKEFHQNSGLYYYGLRYYQPNLQRWLNQDPANENGGINLYCYVNNSPVNHLDPFGLAAEPDFDWDDQNGDDWLEGQGDTAEYVLRLYRLRGGNFVPVRKGPTQTVELEIMPEPGGNPAGMTLNAAAKLCHIRLEQQEQLESLESEAQAREAAEEDYERRKKQWENTPLFKFTVSHNGTLLLWGRLPAPQPPPPTLHISGGPLPPGGYSGGYVNTPPLSGGTYPTRQTL
jgi:RHS repeat-associated protein